MNTHDQKIFDEIKMRAKKDTENWNKAQEEERFAIPLEEDVIMERMFLVHYTEQYLKQQERMTALEGALQQCMEAIQLNLAYACRKDEVALYEAYQCAENALAKIHAVEE